MEASAAYRCHYNHFCKEEDSPKLPVYICPRCESGFIEEVTEMQRAGAGVRHEERDTPEGKKVGGETHRGKQTQRETLLETPGEQGEIKTETGREREGKAEPPRRQS